MDGITSAFILNRYFRENDMYSDIKLVSCSHNEPVPSEAKQEDIDLYILDFCFTTEIFNDLKSTANLVYVMDHHKSAREHVKVVTHTFDMDRAACQIVWDHCYPGKTRPLFVDYVADRDLWKWEMPDSKKFNTGYFSLFGPSFETVGRLIDISVGEPLYNRIMSVGEGCLMSQERNCETIARHAKKAVLTVNGETYTVYVSPCPGSLKSETGNLIANKTGADFSLTWHQELLPKSSNVTDKLTRPFKVMWRGDSEYWCSLRGTGKHDLSVIASALDPPKGEYKGGGGHPNASGFTWRRPLSELFTTIE